MRTSVRNMVVVGAVAFATLLASSVMAVPNLPGTTLPQYISIDFVDRSNLYSSPATGSTLLPGGTFFAAGQEQFNVALLRSVEFGDTSVPPPLTPPTQTGSIIPQPANQQITSVLYDLQLTQIVQTAGIPGVVAPGSAFRLAFGAGTRQPLGGGTFTDLNGDAPAGSGGVLAVFYDDIVAGTDAAPGGLSVGHQGAPGALGLSPIVTDGSLTMIQAYPTVTDGTLLASGAFVPVTAFDIDTFYGPGSGILPSAGGIATLLMETLTVNANGSLTGDFQGWVNFTGGDILNIGLGPQLGSYNLAGRTGSDMAIVGQVFAPSLSGIINVDPGGNPWNLGSTDPVGFAMTAIPEPLSIVSSLLAIGSLAYARRRRVG